MLAITETSWALAFILVVPVVRILLESYAWMTPFYIFAGIGVVFLILFFWLLPVNHIPRTKENTLWQNLGRVFATWSALAGLIMGIVFTMANETVNLIFGVWIEDQFGLNFAALTAASIVIGVSELGGEVSAGLWVDRFGKRRMIWLFLGLNSLAAVLLPLTNGSLIGAMVGLGFFYVTFEVVLVSTLTLMTEVLPTARATMLAVTVAGFSIGRMLGDVIAPGLYEFSFWASVLASVAFNLLAAMLLTQVRVRDR
jgi:predicted MFS family arabinose efflux permease